MDPLSILPAIAAVTAAIATAYLIAWLVGPPSDQGRFTSIDGLRGYLAFFVFLHHSSIWYFYLRSDQWKVPPSNLYTHFGQSSVAIFFMITGFLFFSKLIDGRRRDLDWGKLFVSRFMRLVPLYLFAMFLLFFVVGLLSHGLFNEPATHLVKCAIKWLGFTVLGSPNLNGINHTSIIVAGVTWSLPYEWLFYFSLPLLAIFVGLKPPPVYLAFGLVCVVLMASTWHPGLHHLFSFLGGIVASILVRSHSFRQFSAKNTSSLLVLCLIATTIIIFHSAYGIIPTTLLSLAFSLIAGGNSLFGILVNPTSRTLGEMAYSIYLLHGIILFVIFNFFIGQNEAKSYSAINHWLLIVYVTPPLILSSYCTFRLIERPAIKSTNFTVSWLRSYIGKGKRSIIGVNAEAPEK